MPRPVRASAFITFALSLLFAARPLVGAADTTHAQARDATDRDPRAQEATDPDLQARVEFSEASVAIAPTTCGVLVTGVF